jgi:uncharacterized protein
LCDRPDRSDDRFDSRRTGLDHLSFRVADEGESNRWVERLDALHIEWSPVREAGEGLKMVAFEDPDGIRLEFFVRMGPAADAPAGLGKHEAVIIDRTAGGSKMPVLTEDMQRVVRDQTLGYWATVCEDGSPNLSPKGTTRVWDDDRLFFAEICSPQTLANIRRGSEVEVNVVDPFVRKGYRFKGPARIHERGTPGFTDGIERLRAQGSKLGSEQVNAIVVLEVREAKPLISPVYDDPAATELDILRTFQAQYARLHAQFEATHSSH